VKRKFKYLLSAVLITQSIHGYAKWGDSPEPYNSVTTHLSSPKLAVDTNGDLVLGYANALNNEYDLNVRKFNRDGDALWNDEATVLIERNQGYVSQWGMGLAPDNSIYTISEDQATSQYILNKTSPNGEPDWANPKLLAREDHQGTVFADLAVAEKGVAYGLYYRDDTGYVIGAGMLDHDGKTLWEEKISNSKGSALLQDIKVVKDGVVYLYFGARESDNGYSLFAQKFSFAGEALWDGKPITPNEYTMASRGTVNVQLYDDGDGGVAVTWRQPVSQGAGIQLQYINKDGNKMFAGNGVRLSSSNTALYSDVAAPNIWFNEGDIAISWVSRGSSDGGRTFNYSLFFQRVNLDGELLLGSEPVSIVNNLENDRTIDAGYISGGSLDYYNGQYSVLYQSAVKAAGVGADLRRVDFTPNGEMVRDVVFAADEDGEAQTIDVAMSPYGETVASFRFSLSSSDMTYLNSMNSDTGGYVNTGLLLSEAVTPWVVSEDNMLNTEVSFIDDQNSDYSVSASTDSVHQVEATLSTENKIALAITPAENFTGILPITVTVSDNQNSERSSQYDYQVRVTKVADAPVITQSALTSVGENEAVNFEPQVMDPDSTELTYQWQQTSGPRVVFDKHESSLMFTSPSVAEDTNLAFMLTVSDGELTAEESFEFVVENNQTPVINGQDIQLTEGETGIIAAEVTGAKLPVTVQWQQQSGPALTLSNNNELTTKVYAPFVDTADKATLMLSVTDANGETIEKSFSVYVQNNPNLDDDEINEDEDSGSTGWMFLATLLVISLRRSLNWR